jgi:hypothetical protein
MSIGSVIRIVFAVLLAGAAGWLSLFSLTMFDIMRSLEKAAVDSEGQVLDLTPAADRAFAAIHGAGALFAAIAISGLILSGLLRTRSVIFYMGAAGALTVLLAQAQAFADFAERLPQAFAPLAIAGFVMGAVYWLIAGRFAA